MVALKSLVIGLGVLIVVGVGLLAWGVYRQTADPEFRLLAGPTAGGDGAAGGAPAPHFGDLTVPLPAGCSIAGMRPQGDRLFLRVGPSGPCARVIVIDVARGTVLGTIRVMP